MPWRVSRRPRHAEFVQICAMGPRFATIEAPRAHFRAICGNGPRNRAVLGLGPRRASHIGTRTDRIPSRATASTMRRRPLSTKFRLVVDD